MFDAVSLPHTCPQCGVQMPAGSSSWLCPKCLLTNAGATVPTLSGREGQNGDLPAKALPPTLGDYQLLERIGEGGMGVVYKARQLRLDRIVAVKVLPFGQLANKEYVHRFRTEAVAAGSLQHPNIVGIHEVGLDEGQHYLVMEYVAGPTLADLAREGPLVARRAARYLQLIAEAVHYAHERNILHRDLKPSNILLDANDQPRVTDFGLAKRLESGADLTLSGQVLGSPGYMPPEQASGQRGRVGRRSDVYSLGAILYHLLSGRAPFAASEMADTLRQVLHDEPVAPRLLNPRVPVDLDTICLKCLEKEPARRYPTAQALAEELGRYLRDEPILSRPVSRMQKLWRWCRREPALAGLGASLIGSLLLLGIGGPILAAQQRALAERNRRLLYASDLSRAHQSVQLGNMARVVELLDRNRPQRRQTDLREFSWYYLRRICQAYLQSPTLTHGTPVFMLSCSRDGRLLAASGGGDWVTVWDLAGATPTRVLHSGDPYAGAIAFSPDNRLLLSVGGPLVGAPCHVNLWELASGSRLHRQETSIGMTVEFSPDGSKLAAGRASDVVLLHVSDWREIRTFRGHTDKVWDVRFAPDGRRLSSCSVDGTIRVWDIDTGQNIHTLTGHQSSVYEVVFAPDGRRLASASGDATVRLWDTMAGQELGSYTHDSGVMGVDFSPDGTRVASGSNDGMVKVWDLLTKQLNILRGHSQSVIVVRFVAGGTKLASASFDGTVRLWDLMQNLGTQDKLEGKGMVGRNWETGMALRTPLAFSPDGSRLFTISTNEDAVLIWHAASGKLQRRWPLNRHTSTFSADAAQEESPSHAGLAVAPCKGILAVACEFSPASTGEPNRVELWDLAEDRRTGSFPGRIPLCFSPDGEWLATGGIEPRTLQVTNLSDGRGWSARIEGAQLRLDAIVFSSDNRLLAVACEGELVLRETTSGRTWATLTRSGASFEINALAFSPDGETLAVGRFSPLIELWNVPARKLTAQLPGHLARVMSLAVSPDGKTLASGDQNGTLKLWSLEQREELLHLQAHPALVSSLAFSPDGTVLASGGPDGVRLWRADSRQP